ncbi:sugar O-acetyltransferase [Agarivorans sp. TSD2052]|uniref:sugar O-acetyltransferase n=1 Tax=Agarivorans sp. TSD2052 TaxID=2937286 RepID=UPI00200D8C3B|nr:sugar O-acetyltransferase [Agarivorans sp. TSD2052]UPW17237.1 sugar O-acetyltransferase [Agarivorans sp. TSD2052]
MSLLEKLTKAEAYTSQFEYSDIELQLPAKQLCWEFNQAPPSDSAKKAEILSKLFGTYNKMAFIEATFRCDYGFNIHFHGMAIVNYNCVILDTSPVNIGAGVCIAPGVVISCAGHAIDPKERIQGITTSAPITIEDEVWIGANATVCAGVTIGKGSIIGAGSVVVNDIPAGVIAVGSPCKTMRAMTEKDRIAFNKV